ncbi:hypothetical protein ABS71_12770 [bacterium SCN 62-11]|nr:hypothetical protein [Candidatus Eremiobacteraeota bacterium]ODT64739.1 MAG: hypothetical protein ABS71_12770 [bacterium SCN 62-11]
MWLSIIAYMIRAGVKLGLVETEPETPQGRAYIRAHHALTWLRTQVLDSQLVRVEESLCIYRVKDREYTIRFENGSLSVTPPRQAVRRAIPLVFDPQAVDELELGPQGFVKFSYQNEQLGISLQGGDDSLGEVGLARVELRLRIPLTGM